MEWYQYLSGFFAGAFWGNAFPYFSHGISGKKYPTPFSKLRGTGVSSPFTNRIWAVINILVGYILLITGPGNVAMFLVGIVVVLLLRNHLQKKFKRSVPDKE